MLIYYKMTAKLKKQQAELEALKLKMRKSSVSGTLLILIAIVCMALARTI